MNNNNVLEVAYKKALENKKNDYSSFVWKGEKKKEGERYVQEDEKIVDMSPERLKACYNHCEKMLHNEDPKHLGRYNVLEEVNEQLNKCNVELLLRYYENSYMHNENRADIKRKSLWISLRQLMANNPEITDWTKVPITHISTDLPSEFNDVNISDVMDGCIDYLG